MKAVRMLIICLLSATASLAAAQKKASQPDVFLITIDTLRADHVHCYGYEHIQTPALDSLAKDGIRFAQAFTHKPHHQHLTYHHPDGTFAQRARGHRFRSAVGCDSPDLG